MRLVFKYLPGLALFLSVVCAHGQERSDASDLAKMDPPTLVRKLGDASYRVREQAEKELIRRGLAVLADVKRGGEDEDLEIRRRSQRILLEIQQNEVDVRLKPFLDGKDDGAKMPGWKAFRDVVGESDQSRLFYAVLYKADLPTLETLERDPKGLGNQFEDRLRRLTEKYNGRADQRKDFSPQEFSSLLLVAVTRQPPLDGQASNRLISTMMHPVAQQGMQWNSTGRRLLEKWLEQKCDDPVVGPNMVYMSNLYGFSDIIERRLRPATIKLLDDAAKNPTDTNLFYRAINQARQLGMNDAIRDKLKPGIANMLKTMATGTLDAAKLSQLTNLANQAQNIGGMDEELKAILRPIVVDLAKKQAADLADVSKFYSIVNLARVAQANDVLEDTIRPAFRAVLIKLTAQPSDMNRFIQAFYQAQNLQMQEDIDNLMRPAAEGFVYNLIAKKNEPNSLPQALTLINMFQLKESMRPAAQSLVEEIAAGSTDVNRVNSAIQIIQAADPPDLAKIMEDQIKPAIRKLLIASKEQPVNAGTIATSLHLAEQHQLKEGVDLAIKASLAKSLNTHVRAQALMFIGKNGTRDHAAQLDPVLGEAAELGTTVVNNTHIRTRLGDLALGMMVQLTGQKIDDYGFAWPRLVGQGGGAVVMHSPYCYGFDTDQAREAALKKWRSR